MMVVKDFYNDLSAIVSNLGTSRSGLSQSEIDAYSSTMSESFTTLNSASTDVTAALNVLSSAESALSVAQGEYTLKKAGSSTEAIDAQRAKVTEAAANVLNYQAAVTKSRIISPIDGILTKADPGVGEFVTAGTVLFTVMSDNMFEIEVNLPESDIAKVAVGNPAEVTLDAYGSDVVFGAHVVTIDPAETIIEGVPTYKVTLNFDEEDQRIRSGMTANIDIVYASRPDVIAVPTAAVIERNKQKYVRVPSDEGYEERKVTVGIKGSNGFTEIVDGLNIGDRVITIIK
jgi:HlyD family secretion protein